MGEYAKLKGSGARIKIGTCEDMYYLRADQADQVWPESGNVDPIRDAAGIRYRFPWPNEDGIEPGMFDDFDKSVAIHGATAPEGLEHHAVQFVASSPGYNVCLPCPESDLGRTFGETFTVHRNGFRGAVRLVQQRVWEGKLVAVCECACGARYRLPTLEDAEPIIVACRAEADRAYRRAQTSPHGTDSEDSTINFWHTIADRITAGYTSPPAWVAGVSEVPA